MSLNMKDLVRALKATDQIVTRPVTEWLLKNGDSEYPGWVVDIIAHLLKTKPRYRGGSFSASSAGGCPRAQLLSFLGAQGPITDTQLQNIFNDGKWRHLRWQAMLLTIGALEEVEFPLFWKKKLSRGTMDGVGVVPMDHPRVQWRGKEFGWELKGVSGFQFPRLEKEGPMEKHLDQVHRYFLMSGYELFSIVYEDKSTQRFKEWVIEVDPVRLEQQRQEVEELWSSASSKRLPEMQPQCAAGKWLDCPFAGRNQTCALAGEWPTSQTPGFERGVLVPASP